LKTYNIHISHTQHTHNTKVPLPRWTVPGSSPRPNEIWRSNSNPGMLLDYRRFRRDSVTLFTDNMINQLKGALNGGGVKGKITTNAPGGFWDKALDHNDLFSNMDFAGYDNYPVSEPASIEGKFCVCSPRPSSSSFLLYSMFFHFSFFVCESILFYKYERFFIFLLTSYIYIFFKLKNMFFTPELF
jgi:hypothetical protein